METIGFNKEKCRLGLQSYLAEIEELMGILEDPESLTKDQQQDARHRLSNLKSCLEKDYKARATNKGREKMTEVEASIFYPAVHQSFADVQVTVNSTPSKRWYSDMYQMHGTITSALDQLDRWND